MKQQNLVTLSNRRIVYNLVLLNKIINDGIDSPEKKNKIIHLQEIRNKFN